MLGPEAVERERFLISEPGACGILSLDGRGILKGRSVFALYIQKKWCTSCLPTTSSLGQMSTLFTYVPHSLLQYHYNITLPEARPKLTHITATPPSSVLHHSSNLVFRLPTPYPPIPLTRPTFFYACPCSTHLTFFDPLPLEPYHTVPYHTIPYYTIPYLNYQPYHTIPINHTIPHHT